MPAAMSGWGSGGNGGAVEVVETVEAAMEMEAKIGCGVADFSGGISTRNELRSGRQQPATSTRCTAHSFCQGTWHVRNVLQSTFSS